MINKILTKILTKIFKEFNKRLTNISLIVEKDD